MKKLFLPTLLSMLCTTAMAQFSVAPEGGINFSNMRSGYATNTPAGGVLHTTMRGGIILGFNGNYTLMGQLSLQPGLFYLTNGCNVTGGGQVYFSTIQVPINVQYRLGNGARRFILGAGPYIGFNLGYTEQAGTGPKISRPVSATDTASRLKPIDAGVSITAGISFSNNFYVRLRGQMGFTNVLPHGDEHNFTRLSSLGVTAGYYLYRTGKKAKK